MTKNWTNLQLKKKLNIFFNRIAIYLSLGLHKGRPIYRRSIQPLKENSQHCKTRNLKKNFYSIFVGHFCPPGSGYGSIDLIESGSNPDPKYWSAYRICSGEGFPRSRRQRGLNAQRCDSWVWHYFQVDILIVCPVTVVERPDPHKVNTRCGTVLQHHVYNQESVLFTVDMLFSYRELFFTSFFPSPPSNISHVCRSELKLLEYATARYRIVFPSLLKMWYVSRALKVLIFTIFWCSCADLILIVGLLCDSGVRFGLTDSEDYFGEW